MVGAGQSDTETKVKYITVAHPKPVSGFSADTILGLPSKSLQFKNESSGTITGQVWNFGDGQDSTLLSPTHGYTTPGIYTVSLTTTGPGGSDSLTRNNYIRIAPVWVDINGDAKFGLKDIFPVLKILAGDSTLDENLIFNDINGDAKTGMAEGAYLLQILSHDGIE